ncbi:site-2 protease family protein [Limnochorda pilosa]|uniref:Peptidase M50 domain-containing protein n=1 Tax=Limnochorda pilosa TaxID=1555112 RepID=A0A0K2SNC5_LIMPI|nr:site-2 protease family protein [Limnochorda pilosa]BAS28611.1 hypothetical protein LIP_2782 [Limnochorda pilosa]
MAERMPGAAWPRPTLHPAFILLALVAWLADRGLEFVLVFGSVLLHELAHVGVAVRCGLRPSRVTLYPFGGVAHIPGLEEAAAPARVLVLAAGPAANLLAALGSLAWASALGGTPVPAWVDTLARANLGILVVNLLPLGPLDGGRMAEMVLERWVGTGRARRLLLTAGAVAGAGLAVVGAAGLATGRPWGSLVLFGPFLAVASHRERAGTLLAVLRRSLKGPRRPAVGPARLVAAPVEARARDVAQSLGPGPYRVVAVVEAGGRVRGLLGEGEITAALARGGGESTLGELLAAGQAGAGGRLGATCSGGARRDPGKPV